MDRNELIKYIHKHENFYTQEILKDFTGQQLHAILMRILFKPLDLSQQKCTVCNGSGTVLNIECAKCTGRGTA